MSPAARPWRTRIKFCGFRREQDIEQAVTLGVDALGLIMVPGSPRNLELARAVALRRCIPAFVTAVLLVRDPEPRWLEEVCSAVRPDILQFHGEESVADCRRIGLRYLKAVPMASPDAARKAIDEHGDTALGWVLDSHSAGGLGGRGQTFDWSSVPALDKSVVLAGGLHAGNVGEAISRVRPFAVDVAGGIESASGFKDPQRMTEFVRAVQLADVGAQA